MRCPGGVPVVVVAVEQSQGNIPGWGLAGHGSIYFPPSPALNLKIGESTYHRYFAQWSFRSLYTLFSLGSSFLSLPPRSVTTTLYARLFDNIRFSSSRIIGYYLELWLWHRHRSWALRIRLWITHLARLCWGWLALRCNFLFAPLALRH